MYSCSSRSFEHLPNWLCMKLRGGEVCRLCSLWLRQELMNRHGEFVALISSWLCWSDLLLFFVIQAQRVWQRQLLQLKGEIHVEQDVALVSIVCVMSQASCYSVADIMWPYMYIYRCTCTQRDVMLLYLLGNMCSISRYARSIPTHIVPECLISICQRTSSDVQKRALSQSPRRGLSPSSINSNHNQPFTHT